MILTAVLAAGIGFSMASAMAWGYAMQDAWRGFGENFQLGYVVGFLDAVSLEKRHDRRAFVPVFAKPDYERWRKLMNDYFADPANANRPVADGMAAAGKIFQDEMFKALKDRADAATAPSPAPSGAAPAPDSR
jgi:hypothetical protein